MIMHYKLHDLSLLSNMLFFLCKYSGTSINDHLLRATTRYITAKKLRSGLKLQ